MSTTVTYKGTTITTAENQTRTLATSGKWLEADIVITDVTQGGGGTPAISVVDTTDSHGGTVREITALDISDTTAVASDVAQGKYFYTALGIKTPGTASSGGSTPTLITKNITTNGTYTASNDSADGYSSVTVNVSGGGTPSATAHTIYFEFTDSTNTTITAYWDDSFISDAITATTPTTYGSKTVDSASLDGVAWYTRPTETWETIYDNNSTSYIKDDNEVYPYSWISSLSDIYPTVGSEWRITFNGTAYRCTAKSVSGYIIIGNPKWSGYTDDGTDVPCDFLNSGWGAWTGGADLPNVDQIVPVKIERLVTS